MARGGKRVGAGRPKGSVTKSTAQARGQISEIARKHTKVAMGVLVAVAQSSESDAARVTAAIAILDRGYGKPPQALTGDGGGAIKHEVVVATGIARPAD